METDPSKTVAPGVAPAANPPAPATQALAGADLLGQLKSMLGDFQKSATETQKSQFAEWEKKLFPSGGSPAAAPAAPAPAAAPPSEASVQSVLEELRKLTGTGKSATPENKGKPKADKGSFWAALGGRR